MKTRSKLMNRLLSLALCLCMVLALLPAIPLVAEAAGSTVTVYFQNNWNWNNLRIYYWGSKTHSNPQWPGTTMTYYGTHDNKAYYRFEVPADATGIIFSNNGSDQCQDITSGWYDGITYYMEYQNGRNICKTFDICVDFPELHKEVTVSGHDATCTATGLTDGVKCSRCDAILTEQTTIPANGHVDVDGVDDPAADNNDHCDRCGDELMDIFFKNNWNWSDVRLYYWYGDDTIVPANPGLEMEPYGKNHGYDYYRMKVPTGIEGFIVSGYKDVNSGTREQTVDITSGWYDGATYYPSERSGEKCTVDDFPICVDFPNNHRYESNSKFCKFCGYPSEVTIYFQNNWKWSDVTMYYWGSRIDTTVLEYPGKSMELYDNDGTYDYYYLTIPADCDGIKFSGIKDDGTDTRDESPDITSGWYEDITYSMIWNDGNEVKVFNITEFFPCVHGHTEVTVPATDPTCVDTGWTAGVRCSVCDETLTAQDEIPATGNHVDDDDKKGYCDTCNGLMAPAQLIQTTASLEGNIAVNYFMLLSDEIQGKDTAYMEFTMANGDTIQIPASQSKLIGEYDVFTCEVAAKEMTDIITSQFYYDGGKAAFEDPHVYNVRFYAKHVLETNSDPKTQDLMKAMVNYGAASQAYFDYNRGDWANTIKDKYGKDLVTAPDYENVHITEFSFKPGQGTEKVKLYSASLILNSETTLRLFFNGDIDATYQGKSLDVNYRGGLYYVDIVNIAAKYLDDDVTITINDGTATENITFSPMAYCQIVEQDKTGAFGIEMKNLARALYLYNKAADDYFGDVVPPQGASLYNALHYLNGNQITGQVTSVTFGRSNQHRNIVNGNAPRVLVTDQQDTPATAYYVDNGSGYDVYVLSNDAIYAPKDSTNLFKGMTNMTSMETANFDVSRVELAEFMFRDCKSLQTLDTTDWDTSSVTNMRGMFYECNALAEIIGVNDWDVSNVTNLYATFCRLHAMTELDLSGWDVRSATNIGWVVSQNNNLAYLDISGWNIASSCDATKAFWSNPALTKINATGMKTTGITNATQMFFSNAALTEVTGSGDWQMPNVTTLTSMFHDCVALESLNVHNWGIPKATIADHMFCGCFALEAVYGIGNWDMRSMKDVDSMFYACKSLTTLENSG